MSRNFRRLCGQKLYLGQYEQTKTVTRIFRLCEGIREKRLYVLSLWIHGKLFYFSKVKQIKATQHLIWYSVRWLRGHTNIEFCNEIYSRKRKSLRNRSACPCGAHRKSPLSQGQSHKIFQTYYFCFNHNHSLSYKQAKTVPWTFWFRTEFWLQSLTFTMLALGKGIPKHIQVLYSPECSFKVGGKPSKFNVGVRIVSPNHWLYWHSSQYLCQHHVCVVNNYADTCPSIAGLGIRESLVFCERKSDSLLKKAVCSQSLFCKERRERIAPIAL